MTDNVTIPDLLPTVIYDLIAFAWDMRLNVMTFNMEMEFEHELDLDRLRRALRLAMDAEPVLGCRFDPTPPKIHWRRLTNLDNDILEIAESDERFSEFRHRRINPLEGPLIAAALFREGKRDHLIIKVSHVAADAGGTKEAVEVIADIYNKLEADPDYRPVPNLAGSRDISQVTEYIPWHAYPRIIRNLTKTLLSGGLPSQTLSIDLGKGRPEELSYVTVHLPGERVERIARHSGRFGATLNDMITAAFYRAWAKTGDWDGKKKLRLLMSVDLRRWYLPEGRGQAVALLSSAEFANLNRNLGDGLDDTIKNVTEIIGRRKHDWFGLGIIILIKLLTPLPQAWVLKMFEIFFDDINKNGLPIPGITNMGPIETATVNFGKPPIRAWMLVPPSVINAFFAGVTGYAGGLTLSAGVNPANRVTHETIFNEMLAQLPE